MGAQTSRRSVVVADISGGRNVPAGSPDTSRRPSSASADSEPFAVGTPTADHDSYDGDVEDLEKTFASLEIEEATTSPETVPVEENLAPPPPVESSPEKSTLEEFDVEKFRKVNRKVVSPEEADVQRNNDIPATKHQPLPEYDFLDEQIIASIEKAMMTSEFN